MIRQVSLIQWLRARFRKASADVGVQFFGTFRDKLITDFNHKLTCPCCEDEDCFLSGPQGGMCTNVMCTSCGSRFNSYGFGLDWTHGPQGNIWNNGTQTKFPSAERVARVKEALER